MSLSFFLESNLSNSLFVVLGISVVFSSFGVIFSRNAVHSVVYLISCFLNSSLLVLCLDAEFLAVIFIIIYVGAIAVLFIFVVMMLNVKVLEINENLYKYFPIGLILSLWVLSYFYLNLKIFSNELISTLSFLLKECLSYFNENNAYSFLSLSEEIGLGSMDKVGIFFYNDAFFYKNVQYLSHSLYIDNFVLFWSGGVLLLLAMVGSIFISLNKSLIVKRQNIFSQINKNENSSISLLKKKIIK